VTLREFSGKKPRLGEGVYVDESAVVIGDVHLGNRSSVWPGAVIRADDERVEIGDETAMMDVSFAEGPKGRAVSVGKGCIVSHGARLHGCRLENSVLVGIGAIVLDNAVIGEGSVVAAGALVTPGTVVPARSFVIGVPGRVARQTTEEELAWTRRECGVLVEKAARYRGQP